MDHIDLETLKTLSAKTRLLMLKALAARRKTPSEMSKELKVSPSTVLEHIARLKNAGLVSRVETGHKWVYYEITEKGLNIIQPKTPFSFILSAGAGILFVGYGFIKTLIGAREAPDGAYGGNIAEKASSPIGQMPPSEPMISSGETLSNNAGCGANGLWQAAQGHADWAVYAAIIAGLILLAYGIFAYFKAKSEKTMMQYLVSV